MNIPNLKFCSGQYLLFVMLQTLTTISLRFLLKEPGVIIKNMTITPAAAPDKVIKSLYDTEDNLANDLMICLHLHRQGSQVYICHS